MDPLNTVMKKRTPWDWGELQDKAFEQIKQELSDRILLNVHKGSGRFVIVCDTSDIGIGAALLQFQDRNIEILEFASKSLTTTERNWDTRERECYAIRWSVEKGFVSERIQLGSSTYIRKL